MNIFTFSLEQKKFLLVVLTLLGFCCFPVSVLAENIATGTCGTGLKWSIDNETLTVKGEGEMTDFDNPTDASAKTPSWTPYKKYIKHLVIEDGVTYVGNYAFYDYEQLEDIKFGNTVKRLGNQTFVKCFALTQLNLPESLEQIGTPWTNYSFYGSTFQNCTGITELTLPLKLKHIAARAFSGCTNLSKIFWNAKDCDMDVTGYSHYEIFDYCPIKEVDFGPEVISVPSRAFYTNKGLEIVKTQGSIRYVGAEAFYGSTWLGRQDVGMVYVDHAAYIYKIPQDNPEPIRLELKEGTTSITTQAFQNNKYLVKITVPRTVDRVGKLAFDGCSSLGEVIWNADSVNSALFSESVATFTFGDHVRYIPDYFLSKCSGLSEIKLPESLEYIGEKAFEKCDGITELIIPDKVSYIGRTALYGMKNVKTITIGKGVKDISAYYIFGQCPNLKTVYWNAIRVKAQNSEVNHTSNHCMAGVETVVFGDEVEYVPSVIFRSTPTLTKVILGKNVKEIGEAAFRGDTGLKEIDLPEALEIIGKYAFCESGLESVFIPENVKDLGVWGLGTKALKQVILATKEVPEDGSSFINYSKDLIIYVPDMEKYGTKWTLSQYRNQMQPMVNADNDLFDFQEGKLPQPVFTSNIPDYTLVSIDLTSLDGTQGDHHADLMATFDGPRKFTVKVGYDYHIKGENPDTGIAGILGDQIKIATNGKGILLTGIAGVPYVKIYNSEGMLVKEIVCPTSDEWQTSVDSVGVYVVKVGKYAKKIYIK